MAASRSFTGYVASRFYNELYSAIGGYIEENLDILDLNLRNVRKTGDVSLSDMEVKFVSVNDLPSMKIEFDVIVDAEIEVLEGDYHYDDFDQCNQWFLLRCKGDLDCSLDDFEIIAISTYSQKSKMPKPLSDALVPLIYKEELDNVANDFLQRYYPEALKIPMAVDPSKLAEKMGLDVKLQDITEDLSIFGQVFFQGSTGTVLLLQNMVLLLSNASPT